MLAAALGGARRSTTASAASILLDVFGRRIEVSSEDAHCLQEAASLEAGRSSVARDLSLLLERALAGTNTLALRRSEAHTLCQLAEGLDLRELVARLSPTP